MLKDTLIKCAEFLNRDDIVDALNSANDVDEISNAQIQNDVVRLIHYYNFTMNAACENYLNLSISDYVKADINKKIHYYNLTYEPVRILNVTDELGRQVIYEVTPNFIITNGASKLYIVTYKYLPEKIEKLNEKTQYPENLTEKILIYGIISEFLASKGQFNQSDYWRDKFLNDMFKLKIQKERHVKSTYIR